MFLMGSVPDGHVKYVDSETFHLSRPVHHIEIQDAKKKRKRKKKNAKLSINAEMKWKKIKDSQNGSNTTEKLFSLIQNRERQG